MKNIPKLRNPLLFILITCLTFSVFVFMSGWHDVDLAYNMLSLGQ
jgi:hypothetical protein